MPHLYHLFLVKSNCVISKKNSGIISPLFPTVCKGLSQTLEGHFSVTLAKIRFMMVKKRLDRLRNLQVLLASERSICLGYSMVQCML